MSPRHTAARRSRVLRYGVILLSVSTLGIVVLLWVAWTNLLKGTARIPVVVAEVSNVTRQEEWPERDRWIPLRGAKERRRDFEAPSSSLFKITPIASQKFSSACLDDWVARGVICDDLQRQDPSIAFNVDVVWTYVGVSELLSQYRSDAEIQMIHKSEINITEVTAGAIRANHDLKTKRRFRDHGELKYSMRSVQAAFAGAGKQPRNLHLLTTDLPAPSSLASQDPTIQRIGQVPTWIDQDSIATSSLKIHHHSNFFDSTTILPTFNSLSIESQMGNLQNTSDYLVYMNDDLFFTSQVSVASFASPWTGPVFRFRKTLGVNSVSPKAKKRADGEGEWKGLEATNYLLEARFGQRSRTYVEHIPKVISMPVFKEAGQVWAKELEETAAARFRGKGDEITPVFLVTHYHVERHREALLWSYLVARADVDRDGYLSLAEQQRILEDLGVTADTSHFDSQLPRRSISDSTHPIVSQHHFSSTDGYAFATGFSPDWPTFDATHFTTQMFEERDIVCRESIVSCFGEGFGTNSSSTTFSTNDVFKRVAFETPSCGDCLILKVKSISGRGLEVFLPAVAEEVEDTEDSVTKMDKEVDQSRDWEVLSLDRNWEDIDFTSSIQSMSSVDLRRRAISLIQRYSYTVGAGNSHLASMRTASQVTNELRQMLDQPISFLVLNDDIESEEEDVKVREVLQEFFEPNWGNPLSFEKKKKKIVVQR